MLCPLCRSRQSRRHCPALEREICSVCCGTKRRVEIRCPDSCGYLTNAQVHPPAAIRRQQEQDVAALLPALTGLAEPGQQLLLQTLVVIDQARGSGLDAARDADVADAADALARTYETAARGVIYEHRAASAAAQRLAAAIRHHYDDLSRRAPSSFVTLAADVLRRVGDRVQAVHTLGFDAETGFLDLGARVAAQLGPLPASDAPQPSASPLILP